MKRVVIAYVLLLVLCAVAHVLHARALLEGVNALLIPAYLLFAAFWLTDRNPSHYGLSLGGILNPLPPSVQGAPTNQASFLHALRNALPSFARELGFALLLAAIVFPLYALGWKLWLHPATPFELQWHPQLWDFVAMQVLLVALPEEAFFRGLLQTTLSDRETRRIRVLGTTLAPLSWIAQAALFAVVHLIGNGEPARLAVFFPGLLFGWIRARRNGIGAAVLFHAMCNIVADTLARSWFP